jgi:hypothetical protein
MLKKTMTYEGFNGEPITEDFYFNLSKAELVEMEFTAGKDGFAALMAKIIAEDDREKILKTFKEIILMSIGRRSEDGRRFEKSEQISREFEQTPAFSDLLFEFYSESGNAAEFVAGIVPSDLGAQVEKAIADGTIETVNLPDGTKEPVQEEAEKIWSDYSEPQLLALSQPEFERLYNKIKGPKPAMLVAVAMKRKARSE